MSKNNSKKYALLIFIQSICILLLTCSASFAATCIPDCDGLDCGDDGCGSSCGTCTDSDQCSYDICDAGLCVPVPINEEAPCDDGYFCSVGETCNNGACSHGQSRNCSEYTSECAFGDCDEISDRCYANSQPKEGFPCDDFDLCTSNDLCDEGTCRGLETLNCDHLSDQCNIGMCNPESGECMANPINQGAACDDSQFCTVSETCSNGICSGGQAYDCSNLDDQCNTGQCNESFNRCDASPVNDYTTCDDNLFCTIGESCQNGLCTMGSLNTCDSEADQCNSANCDEASDTCIKDPSTKEGDFCDDDLFCSIGETCNAGICTNGKIYDCTSVGDQCNQGVCNEETDSCIKDPTPYNDVSCNDNSFCTVSETCTNGECTGGEAYDCSYMNQECIVGECSEVQDSCVLTNKTNGIPCEGGDFCVVSEACNNGECTGGSPRDCSMFDDQCNTGLCNESTNTCYGNSGVHEGRPCEDGLFCTEHETCRFTTCTPGEDCMHGLCAGGQALDCNASGVITEAQCQDASCDEAIDECVVSAINEGLTCDDSTFCFVNETCNNGQCLGESRDCNSAISDEQCQTAHCNESENSCQAIFVTEGTACEDGSFCTVQDSCHAGICSSGVARDCSNVIENAGCQSAICNDQNDSCETLSINSGQACDDGEFCTVQEKCNDGLCVSDTTKDCSGDIDDEQCQLGSCNEDEDECQAESINEGMSCDDSDLCTEIDVCTQGVCGGSEIVCDNEITCSYGFCNSEGTCEYEPDHDSCDDQNPCTINTCNIEAGCEIENLEDWSDCSTNPDAPQVCLEQTCTETPANDTCVDATNVSINALITSNIESYHNFMQTGEPCSDTALIGADTFYKFKIVQDIDYFLRLEYECEIDLNIVLRNNCDNANECLNLGTTTGYGKIAYLDSLQANINDVIYIQIISKDVLLETDECGYSFHISADITDGDLDTDMADHEASETLEIDSEVDCDITDTDKTEIDTVEVDTIEADTIVTDGDIETVCEPYSLMCNGKLIMRCNLQGTGWSVQEECWTDEVCIDGQCVENADGDIIDADKDSVEKEVETNAPVTGDGDIDSANLIDGDEETTDDNGNGGGCSSSTTTSAIFLFAAFVFIAILRRRESL